MFVEDVYNFHPYPRRLCYYKNVYTLKSTLSEEEIKILSNC